ncbi:copper resistance protein B [Altererythrobacter xiamenensis]|uniref:Copper resistance protein B n=1 Tax=Altererythrobacter xiamenensis TaxID=1316679 RepID=A0A1Y6EMF1_9SPHN|nr:copper resistance protein B [Altererythrobacter xiamenensis]SMQ63747.1 copper resistance protein B [Altererythrobacter xiamenensis]
MRALLLASAALFAMPLAAQDHAHHGSHAEAEANTTGEAMDHCAMGHLPPEQCPPAEQPAEPETMDHSQMDHSQMDHSAMGHAQPQADADPHAGMDHSQMDHSGMDHSGHSMDAMDKSAPGAAPESAVPPRALEGPRHAADAIWGEAVMAPAREQLADENGGMKTGMVMVERLEARIPVDGGEDGYLWDAQSWYGGDLNRFVLKTEGEGEIDGALEDAEVQALFSRAIGPFFDLQAGARIDVEPETRSHLVLGVQGLAPYMFHVDGALFLSDRGDLTARVEAEYDQKITHRLILQPRFELEAAAQDIPERDVGAGLTKIEPGLRLRYEIAREFAPYVGIEYEAKLGETADIARAKGEDPDGFKFLVGLRAWF